MKKKKFFRKKKFFNSYLALSRSQSRLISRKKKKKTKKQFVKSTYIAAEQRDSIHTRYLPSQVLHSLYYYLYYIHEKPYIHKNNPLHMSRMSNTTYEFLRWL